MLRDVLILCLALQQVLQLVADDSSDSQDDDRDMRGNVENSFRIVSIPFLCSLTLDPTSRYLRRNHLLLAAHLQELSLEQRMALTQPVPRHHATEHRRSAQRSIVGGLSSFVEQWHLLSRSLVPRRRR